MKHPLFTFTFHLHLILLAIAAHAEWSAPLVRVSGVEYTTVVTPHYDRTVKRLIADGNACINLGFPLAQYFTITARVSTATTAQSGYWPLFGAKHYTNMSLDGSYFTAGEFGSGFLFAFMWIYPNGLTIRNRDAVQTNALIAIESTTSGVSVAAYGKSESTTNAVRAGHDLYLFAEGTGGDGIIGNYARSNTSIHAFSYVARDASGGTVTRRIDLVPVVKGGIGYMYDRANPSGGPTTNGLYGVTGGGRFGWEENDGSIYWPEVAE